MAKKTEYAKNVSIMRKLQNQLDKEEKEKKKTEKKFRRKEQDIEE